MMNSREMISEQEVGKWEIIDISETDVESNVMQVMREGEKVTFVFGMYVEEDRVEFEDHGTVIHEKAFQYDEELAKYSLETITYKELIDEVLLGNPGVESEDGNFVWYQTFMPSVLPERYSEEVKNTVYDIEMDFNEECVKELVVTSS